MPDTSARIKSVDGLRALAVLGVMWAHAWAFTGTPKLVLMTVGHVSVDLSRVLAIGGTGVDLFFVISGFCMYLMYARKEDRFNVGSYRVYIAKRFKRIAPAYYVAVLVTAAGWFALTHRFPWGEVASHAVFGQTVIPGTGTLCAPFWSLATEWHFYLVLPAIVVLTRGLGIVPALIAIGSVSLAGRTVAVMIGMDAVLSTQVLLRLLEFVWGIAVAALVYRGVRPPRLLTGSFGVCVAIVVVCAGRVLMTSQAVHAPGALGPLCRIMGEPVLTFGFALLLWNVIADSTPVSRVLCVKPLQKIGLWSYSMYLWHWWPTVWSATFFSRIFGKTLTAQYATLAAVLVIVVPVSYVSFTFLEAPYFKRRRLPERPSGVPVIVPASQ